jgi:hypothetical protein
VRTWLFWCIIVLLYWAAIVKVLRASSPVFMDGSGPMPSFYWSKSRPPTPGIGEYYKNRAYYDRLFSLPYYTAALVITILGCAIAPWIARRSTRRRVRTFFISVGASLVLICVASLIADVGDVLGWWRGPRILLIEEYPSPYNLWVRLKIFIPACILSGAVAVGLDLVTGRRASASSSAAPI